MEQSPLPLDQTKAERERENSPQPSLTPQLTPCHNAAAGSGVKMYIHKYWCILMGPDQG